MNYGYKKQVAHSFVDAIAITKEELQKQGFGVLTEIDVKATMKNKLDLDYDNYIILGACNPQFAHQALEAEKEIGLFLPCNVIIYEEADQVFVSTILPAVMMGIIGNPDVDEVAIEVETKLKEVIDEI